MVEVSYSYILDLYNDDEIINIIHNNISNKVMHLNIYKKHKLSLCDIIINDVFINKITISDKFINKKLFEYLLTINNNYITLLNCKIDFNFNLNNESSVIKQISSYLNTNSTLILLGCTFSDIYIKYLELN